MSRVYCGLIFQADIDKESILQVRREKPLGTFGMALQTVAILLSRHLKDLTYPEFKITCPPSERNEEGDSDPRPDKMGLRKSALMA